MGWIANSYGSKSGMLKHLYMRAGWRLHPLTRQKLVLGDIERLVFVCKGNICRSALAQAVAGSLDFPALSFGYLTTPGKPADPGMSRASSDLGFDLSGHVTTRIDEYQPNMGDMVLFFEVVHLRQVAAAEGYTPPRALLGLWARPRRPHIHDPFGGSPGYYLIAAGVIRQAVTNLIAEIRSVHRA
jgi:protein-tyrosine phosphatase